MTDRQVADAARAYAAAQVALEDTDAPAMLTAILVRDLAWYVLLHEVNADTIVDTEPL
jgi:hypothetical protein